MRIIFLVIITLFLTSCHLHNHNDDLKKEINHAKQQKTDNASKITQDYHELVSNVENVIESEEESDFKRSIKLSGAICHLASCQAIITYKNQTYFLLVGNKFLNKYTVTKITFDEIDFQNNQSITIRVSL